MKWFHSNEHNMRILHWILFVIAVWIIIVPFIGYDIAHLILGETRFAHVDLLSLLKLDDLFLGIGVMIIALTTATLEQLSQKQPGLKAMHYLQVVLGLWIAIAPFAVTQDMTSFTWSHVVSGGFIAIFALLQIRFER